MVVKTHNIQCTQTHTITITQCRIMQHTMYTIAITQDAHKCTLHGHDADAIHAHNSKANKGNT